MGVCANVNTQNLKVGKGPTINENATKNKVDVPQGLDSDLGDTQYWSNGTIANDEESYMLSVVAIYSNMYGLWSTPQYDYSRGMTKFKQERYDAISYELSSNLIGMKDVNILDKKQITKDFYISALSYLMFLKRKSTDDAKARGCANSRPQRKYISKEESSLLIIYTYALFISCAVDAMEGHEVVTCNILGAFLQANWLEDNDCYIKFEGLMVKMICKIDPSYKKYVLTNKTTSKKRLYGKLIQAVYGTLLGAVLF